MYWSVLPSSGIVSLTDVGPTDMAMALDDLPDDAPAVLLVRIDEAVSSAQVIDALVVGLEKTTYDLYPAWLPGAEVSPGRGTIDRLAARALASELASGSEHYRPYVTDLATNAVAAQSGTDPRTLADKYSTATRIAGTIRVLASSFDRDRVVIAWYSSNPLPIEQQQFVATACDWLASYVGVWLLDSLAGELDRFATMSACAPQAAQAEPHDEFPWVLRTVTFPPVSGRPHPSSNAEQRLESHLTQRAWASDRRWNHLVPTGDLEPYVRADLVWPEARLVVEIDGADHRTAVKYADDRRRDVALQLAGYLVVRFTNEQVLSDTTRVADIIEKLRSDRLAAKELP